MASSVSCVASGGNYHHHLGEQAGPGDRNRVIGELNRGRDMADHLRRVLRQIGSLENPSALESAGNVPAMVAQILDTFTQSISILTGASHHHVDVGTDEFSGDIVIPPPPPARKLEGSGDSCKTTRQDRRGCHKRKRTTETWTEDSPTWPEDRFAWRKYGQKVILHAKHPRNYFRCTHKYDEGCPATKQVQKIQDDPPVFRATYHAHHSCTSATANRTSSTSSLGLPYPDPAAAAHNDSSIIWSFQEPCHDLPHRSAAPTAVIKAPDSCSCPKSQIQSSSSSPNTCNRHLHEAQDCYMPAASGSDSGSGSDFGSNPSRTLVDDTCTTHTPGPDQLPHLAAAYSSAGSDHQGDVYSCTASSTQTMGMEMEMTNSMISLDDLLDI